MGQVHNGSATTTAAVRRALSIVKRASERSPSAMRSTKDGREVEEAHLRCRSANRPSRAQINGAVDRGGGRRCRFPAPHAFAARRLPLRAPAHHPTPDTLVLAPLPSAAWDQPVTRHGRQQAAALQVQALPNRLLPHRHCGGQDRARQAPPLRGHRLRKPSSPSLSCTSGRRGGSRPTSSGPWWRLCQTGSTRAPLSRLCTCLRAAPDRAPPDQASAPMDEWSGRAH